MITPIGELGTKTRRDTDGLIEVGIRPVLRALGYQAIVPHEMDDPGSITRTVLQHLVEDELVIANLSGLNPNVMYELAVRHSARLPVVTLVDMETELPFDIADQRVLRFENDALGYTELREPLKRAIRSASGETEPANAVYRAVQAKLIQEEGPATDAQAYLLEQFETLRSEVRERSRDSPPTGPRQPPAPRYLVGIEGGKLSDDEIEELASHSGLSWTPRPAAGATSDRRQGLVRGASRDVMSFLHALGHAEGSDVLVEAERMRD